MAFFIQQADWAIISPALGRGFARPEALGRDGLEGVSNRRLFHSGGARERAMLWCWNTTRHNMLSK